MTAAVGVLTLELRIHGAHSLKDKRQVLRALKDRLRKLFNVSVAETAFQDTWQHRVVSVAAIASDRTYVESVLTRAEEEAAELLGGDLVETHVELI